MSKPKSYYLGIFAIVCGVAMAIAIGVLAAKTYVRKPTQAQTK